MARAERALARYEALARVGRARQRGKGLIYAAGTAVVADDVSGIGAADNVFLPFLLVGLLAVHLATEAPAPPPELAQAWGEVIASLEAVGQKAKVEAARMSRRQPPRSDCLAHYARCLETRLGDKHSGGRWGHSICQTASISAKTRAGGPKSPAMAKIASGGIIEVTHDDTG